MLCPRFFLLTSIVLYWISVYFCLVISVNYCSSHSGLKMPPLYLLSLKQAAYSKYNTAFYSYVLQQNWIYRVHKSLQEGVFSIVSWEV